jgi:ECF transporter S component (folate family)
MGGLPLTDAVLHAVLDFVGAHSALLTILILVLLVIGMVLCLTVQKRRFTVREIAAMGMLAALNVVLAEVCKITFIPNVLVLSFGFLPIALCGMLFGIAPTVTVAVVADILGALLFSSGSFYFGYTLTAFLTGLFYAAFLHKKQLSVLRCVLCQLLVSLVCYALLNSLWALNWVTQTAAVEYIGTRLLAQPILYPIYLVFLLLLRKYRKPLEEALRP